MSRLLDEAASSQVTALYAVKNLHRVCSVVFVQTHTEPDKTVVKTKQIAAMLQVSLWGVVSEDP